MGMTEERVDAWEMVGRAVRDARAGRGWSQERLAREAGVSLKTVSNLETHRVNRRQDGKVGVIWRALGLPTAQLNRILDAVEDRSAAEDDEVTKLRDEVLHSGAISDAMKQAILTLIDAEATARYGHAE